MKEKLALLKKKWLTVVGILAFVGLTPAGIYTYIQHIEHQLRNIYTNNIVYNSAFRSLMPLKYTGYVYYEDDAFDIEIRSTWIFDDFQNDFVEVEWIFVIHNDHVAMYEGVYSPVQRTYHFVDMYKKYYYVKGLTKMEESKVKKF
jgi:hypothetical protein